MRFTPRFRFSGEIRRIRKYGGKAVVSATERLLFNFSRSGMTGDGDGREKNDPDPACAHIQHYAMVLPNKSN